MAVDRMKRNDEELQDDLSHLAVMAVAQEAKSKLPQVVSAPDEAAALDCPRPAHS